MATTKWGLFKVQYSGGDEYTFECKSLRSAGQLALSYAWMLGIEDQEWTVHQIGGNKK